MDLKNRAHLCEWRAFVLLSVGGVPLKKVMRVRTPKGQLCFALLLGPMPWCSLFPALSWESALLDPLGLGLERKLEVSSGSRSR